MVRSVVIHAGLPKTGTSAIQRWLLTHTHELMTFGVRYPTHPMDKNGITSGNFRNLLEPSRQGNGPLQVSKERIASTLHEFHGSTADVLLISSERAWRYIPELAKHIPTQTRFILYVRDPVELRESGYNQRVKRSGVSVDFDTDLLRFTRHPAWELLPKVPEMLDSGIDIELRAYHPRLFHGGTLLHDFLAAIGLPPPHHITPESPDFQRINRSYSLHALEFKRALNALDSPLPKGLDEFLQTYVGGPTEYSIIHPRLYTHLRAQADVLLADLSRHGVHDLEQLRSTLDQETQRPHVPQSLSDSELQQVVTSLQNEHAEVLHRIKRILNDHPGINLPYPSLRDMITG